MTNPTYTDKSELLYRRISSNKFSKTPDQYIVDRFDNITITSCAFLGGEKPSVDRAKLIGFNPKITRDRGEPTGGVVSMISSEIQSIHIGDYIANVKIRALPDNPAHAEIVLIPKPDRMTRGLLSDLRDALARKATCIVKPNPL